MENWRKASNDASFAALNAHDLEISLTEGTFADRGELARIARSVTGRDRIDAAEERLVAPTQVAIERRRRAAAAGPRPGRRLGRPQRRAGYRRRPRRRRARPGARGRRSTDGGARGELRRLPRPPRAGDSAPRRRSATAVCRRGNVAGVLPRHPPGRRRVRRRGGELRRRLHLAARLRRTPSARHARSTTSSSISPRAPTGRRWPTSSAARSRRAASRERSPPRRTRPLTGSSTRTPRATSSCSTSSPS